MLAIHPQYIKDTNGKNSFVTLPVKDFDALMEQVDNQKDVRLFDELMKDNTGERVPMA